MVNAWSILAIVLALGVIALVGFTIPILIQIKDLLKMAETTVTRVEKDIEPVLNNVEGITHNVEGIIGAANDFVHRKPSNEPGLVDKIKDNVEENVNIVKEEYIPVIKKTTKDYYKAMTTGFRVGINTFKSSKKSNVIILPAAMSSPTSLALVETKDKDVILVDTNTSKEVVLSNK